VNLTKQNLAAAFAGESQANRRYLFFAKKAEDEDQPQIANLFRAAAEAETVHAHNHLRVMGDFGDTADNLKMAISGESHEFTEMYPGFIEQAKADSDSKAGVTFGHANKVEEIHHGLFKEALQDLEAGKTSADKPYFVCQICGNTVLGKAPLNCPICGAPRSMFKQVD
jgi:rubrerythrin